MTRAYWDSAHNEKYSTSSWAKKPSMFAEFCLPFLPKQGKILDLGTGQGQDAVFFHKLGYEVVGIDYSEQAVASAKAHYPNIKFIKADIANGLPFKDQEFDVVYSHLALHYFDHRTTEKIFKDIHRILKPNGVVATLTNTVEDPELKLNGYIKLETDFYQTPEGIQKRYFSIASIEAVAHRLFSTLIADSHGETYKDEIKTLIRFIGKKI